MFWFDIGFSSAVAYYLPVFLPMFTVGCHYQLSNEGKNTVLGMFAWLTGLMTSWSAEVAVAWVSHLSSPIFDHLALDDQNKTWTKHQALKYYFKTLHQNLLGALRLCVGISQQSILKSYCKYQFEGEALNIYKLGNLTWQALGGQQQLPLNHSSSIWQSGHESAH